MQLERNLLHSHIIPQVNYALKKKDDYAYFLDFRWGIDTMGLEENIATKKVLTTCFDGIENSSCIIVFIGDNYGISVSKNILKYIQINFNIENCAEKSITELEVDYATKSKAVKNGNIIFYFKDNENGIKYDQRVKRLRKKIESLYPNQIKHYCLEENNENFQKSFINMLTNDIITCFEKSRSLLANNDENITRNNVSKYSCRVEQLNKTAHSVLKNQLSVVYGKSGCGKTVFMSALKDKLSFSYHSYIIYLKKGYNSKYIKYKLWNFLGSILLKSKYEIGYIHYCDEQKAIMDLIRIINSNVSEIKDIIFLIDGIDKLSAVEISDTLKFLQKYSEKLHFVISLDTPNNYLFESKPHLVFLNKLCNEDKISVIKRELQINKKMIPPEAIKILIKKQDSEIPLYLVLAVKRLVNMQKNDYDRIYNNEDNIALSINNHIIEIIKSFSENIENMIMDYIGFSENIINEKLAINISSFLSASAYGLTDIELYFLIERHYFIFEKTYSFTFSIVESQIANVPTVDFYLFLKYLSELLNINSYFGKIYFENSIVQKTVFERYSGNYSLQCISEESHFSEQSQLLSNSEMVNATIRCRASFKRDHLFKFINYYVIKHDKLMLNIIADEFFDALIKLESEKNLILELLDDATYIQRKKHYKDRQKEIINTIKFILEYIVARFSSSMIIPFEYITGFQKCISYLREHTDYSLIENRMFLIMAELNIAIMCYNFGYIELSIEISKSCKAKFNAVPMNMRNEIYYDALNLYKNFADNFC